MNWDRIAMDHSRIENGLKCDSNTNKMLEGVSFAWEQVYGRQTDAFWFAWDQEYGMVWYHTIHSRGRVSSPERYRTAMRADYAMHTKVWYGMVPFVPEW